MFELIPAAVLLLPVSWMWLRIAKISDRVDNMYDKTEVKEIIDLKNKPIIDAVDRNTKSQEELAKAISELRQELIKRTV